MIAFTMIHSAAGVLTIFKGNSRSIAILAVAKANKIELEVIERTPEKPFPPEYLKLNPLSRVPSFEGSDGYVVTECIAIAVYSESYPSSEIAAVHLLGRFA